MDNILIIHPRAHTKAFLIFFILFLLNLISLIIYTVNYCLSKYSLDYLIEDDPVIDLTGLKSFSFSSSENKEYFPSISNLGTTGKLYFDCFVGKCKYEEEYECDRTECHGEGDDRECTTYTDTCYSHKTVEEKSCSSQCRKLLEGESYKGGCGSYYCNSPPSYDYYYDSSSCSRDDDDDYASSKSCNADNLILYWKFRFYERKNNTSYQRFNYLNSAVEANQTCPENKKVCGILDDLGNKFCYPSKEECPINYISLINDTNSTNYTYKSIIIDSVTKKTLYYTNNAIDKKIVGGLFVDSDLLIKYKDEDCVTLDNDTIQHLIDSQYNTIYRDLKYDPDSHVYKNGKSYLKWCIPGHGKEKNITKIKELKVIYDYNVTTNLNIVNPSKKNFKTSYFILLTGFLLFFFLIILLTLSFCAKNDINFEHSLFDNSLAITILFIFFIISLILILIGSIISIANNSNLSEGTSLDLGSSIFNVLKIINIIDFCLSMLLVILSVVFFIYLYLTPSTYIDSTNTTFNKFNDNNYSNTNNNYNMNNNYNSYNNNNGGYNSSDFNNNNNTNNNGYKLSEDEIKGGFTYQ